MNLRLLVAAAIVVLLGLGGAVRVYQALENQAYHPPVRSVTAETNTLLFVSGVACVGYVVIALVTAATVAFLRGEAWRRIALRALGSWVTAIGIMLIAFRFAAR